MEYASQTIESDNLQKIMEVLETYKGQRIRVNINPVNTKECDGDEPDSLFGSLHEYANPDLIPLEEGAWERSVTDDLSDYVDY